MEQLQSHICMTNGLLIYGEIFAHLWHFLIYDFATAPLWISLYQCIWGKFYFIFYQCNFDRVFTIFFLNILVGWLPCKKSTVRIKPSYMKCQSKFSFCTLESPRKYFFRECQSYHQGFYLWQVHIFSREQNWERSRVCSLILVYVLDGDSVQSV